MRRNRRAINLTMKIPQLSLLALALVIPVLALLRLSETLDYRLVGSYVFLVSLIGFLACFRDKRKAEGGTWRTPEATLHFIELAGGWAGSFAAQRHYRHKTSKTSYQVMFWLIVLLHQLIALDFILDWRFLSQLVQAAPG